MITNIIKLLIIVNFITGCGDTGEKFANAVKKIQADQIERSTLSKENRSNSITEKNNTKSNQHTKRDDKSKSLQDITVSIKKAISPTNKIKEDIKKAISITKQNVKEVITDKKESAKNGLIKVKKLAHDTRKILKDKAQKIKELIDTEKIDNRKSILDEK